MLTAHQLAQSTGRISEVQANEHGVFWIEQRPTEKGRNVIMHWQGKGKPVCLTPDGQSVGNRVNEYGGGSYYLQGDRVIYGEVKTGQWNYEILPPLKKHVPDSESGGGRGGFFTSRDGRLADPTFYQNHFVFVQEANNTQSLIEISLKGEVKVLDDQHDFYAAPRFNPQTGELVYLSWDLPSMPWDGTVLGFYNSSRSSLPRASFISQPTWHNNQLYLLSDHENFGQLYHYHENQLIPVCKNWPENADAALPLWTLGMQSFLPIGEERFAIIYSRLGWYYLGVIDKGVLTELALPFCAFGEQLALWQNQLAFSAATPTEGFAVRLMDLSTLEYQTISEQAAPLLKQEAISLPEPIHFPTSDGDFAHAFFYRPQNPNPPLIVMSHGGPTFYTHAGYSNKIQFWTQNGFAVVDVNYRGSTGFGRTYWQALKHAWGEADAKDCIAAAEYVVKQGWVNPDQLFIRGSSAGGFLSLCAMASSDLFKAGAIYYGVSDLSAFMDETHRFESGYNDWLVGKTVRSPVDRLEHFTRPIIFFHGLKDTVVPVSHSEVLYTALKVRGVYTELHTYPEEGHSFRAANTLVDSLTKELAFFRRFL